MSSRSSAGLSRSREGYATLGTIMQIVSFKRTPYERGDPVGRYLFTLSTLQKEHAIKFKEVGSESFRLQG